MGAPMRTEMMASMAAAECGPSILVVEDEVLISDLVSEALAERGFQVHVVARAEDALSYLASGRSVSLLFTDINLAGEMDGSALAVRARALRPSLPVVYASGRLGGLDRSRAVPGALFVPKPYRLDDVCGLLARLAFTPDGGDQATLVPATN
jgi:CheY-like chemotaxis protein